LDIPRVLRVLVVEDSVEISEAIGFFCSQRKDIDYQAMNTGQEGLDRIRAEDFDLILLDLGMPDLSGMDVLLSLKLDGLIKSRNIVVFTASSNQDLLHELREMGVKEIFKKPFSLDDLIKLIEKYRPGTQKR
jgi:two-component system response regulator CiaR